MRFDPCQLGQTDLALEQDTEALASILARHGRDHGWDRLRLPRASLSWPTV